MGRMKSRTNGSRITQAPFILSPRRRGGRSAFKIFVLLAVTVFVAKVPHARADNRRTARLFSGSAREMAEQRHRGAVDSQRERLFSTRSVGQAAELDTVKDILGERHGNDFFVQYRGPFYMAYVYDIVPLPYADDEDSEAMAQRALLYQAATSFSKVIIGSALEPLYRRAVEGVKWFRSYTSLKVRQEGDGGLAVSDRSKEKPLFELKLHVSANNGVEPRVQFGDNCTLRYDVINQDTVLEYKKDF